MLEQLVAQLGRGVGHGPTRDGGGAAWSPGQARGQRQQHVQGGQPQQLPAELTSAISNTKLQSHRLEKGAEEHEPTDAVHLVLHCRYFRHQPSQQP